MKLKLFFIGLCVLGTLQAQYTTPNTGVRWTLSDIATASPTTLSMETENVYVLHDELIIAETDTFYIQTPENIGNQTLKIAEDVKITVFGSFFLNGRPDTDPTILITAEDEESPYKGFRFEQGSHVSIEKTRLQYGGGLQVLTEDFTLKNCILQHNVSGVNTGAVVNLSRGIVNIIGNHFLNNRNPAIASAANSKVSGNIVENVIEKNNYFNNNRPQINMGPTRDDAPLIISSNAIIGDRDFDMVGGIAIANFGYGTIKTEISNNKIIDNRYGIAIYGISDDQVIINGNRIEDNNTNDDAITSGSGINLYSPTGKQNIMISENEIRNNLWGITIQNNLDADTSTIKINLGDGSIVSPGNNIFADNKNEGAVYALYNNGPATIMAQNNCWKGEEKITLEQAENVIFHRVDSTALGEVIFNPMNLSCTYKEKEEEEDKDKDKLSINSMDVNTFSFFPNPAGNRISFDNTIHKFQHVNILTIQGKKVIDKDLFATSTNISFDLPQGIYIIQFTKNSRSIAQKLIIQPF